MLSVVQRSPQTVDDYSRQAVSLIAQCHKETLGHDERQIPLVLTAEWFLGSLGRWSAGTIRIYALALEQEIDGLLEYDRFDPDSREGQILWRLKNDRPASIKKVKRLEKEGAVARCSSDVRTLIEQFQIEHPGGDLRQLPVLAAAEWFLELPGRWTAEWVTNYALALEHEIKSLLKFDAFDPESREGLILQRLKNNRPPPLKAPKQSKTTKAVAHQHKVAAKSALAKQRTKRRKSMPMNEMRKLVRYFRSREDEFSLWIAGYIIIASRLGWRPGEIINLQRQDKLIRAAAKKHTNGRGLYPTCEIDISAYFNKAGFFKDVSLTSEIDRWITDGRKWETYHGGSEKLLANINGRLATASNSCKIRRVCTYSFRHFAIASMKASGFSRDEIAVIVNHASNRTAEEHYGKRQHGVKRPRKMLGFDRSRLQTVRNLARSFKRPTVSDKNPIKKMRTHAAHEKENAVVEPEGALPTLSRSIRSRT